MKFLVVFSCVFAVALAKPGFLVASYPSAAAILPGAPIGPDGRVQDTFEVAAAKASHAAAHLNERLNLNQEALRSADAIIAAPIAPIPAPIALPAAAPLALPAVAPIAIAPRLSYGGVVLAGDNRPLDEPAVAAAKASHAAAHLNERLNHANEATRNFLLSGTYY